MWLFLMVALATSAISITLTESHIAVHQIISERWKTLHKLFSCHWCVSHWVAAFFVLYVYPFSGVYTLIDIMAVVCAAGIFSGIIMRLSGD